MRSMTVTCHPRWLHVTDDGYIAFVAFPRRKKAFPLQPDTSGSILWVPGVGLWVSDGVGLLPRGPGIVNSARVKHSQISLFCAFNHISEVAEARRK
jgi:hypothetical protein